MIPAWGAGLPITKSNCAKGLKCTECPKLFDQQAWNQVTCGRRRIVVRAARLQRERYERRKGKK